jgi:hypoxanthine phosphoribosyltransferase
MMKYTVEKLLSEHAINNRVVELARQINIDYKGQNDELVVLGLLRGSFIFMADLSRQIGVGHSIDFLTVSSYGDNMLSSQNIDITRDLSEDIQGKHVLIVEDIIDTGITLNQVCDYLMQKRPKSLEICTLLDKPSRRVINVNVKYTGFSIPDEFVVGYGLDYAQKHRHLPYVGKVIMAE